MLAELDRERQPHIAEADHTDPTLAQADHRPSNAQKADY
jgi:hypothetical protein